MYYFNDVNEKVRIFFLQHEHLLMIKGANIPFKDLTSLLYYNVAREDLLSWISFQRAMEDELFKRKFTKLETAPEIKFRGMKPKHDMELLTPELERVYRENKYYDGSQFYSYTLYDNTLVIVAHNSGIDDEGYIHGEKNITRTIYQALLSKIGYHRFYFNEPVKNKEELGITLAELISILTV